VCRVNLPGSSDCVRNLATGEVLVAVPTVEPVVAILGLTGVKTQVFYTVFRRNIGALLANSDMPSFATSQAAHDMGGIAPLPIPD
jgi:NitT/TauT family transport system substrate-binding protein